MFERMNLETNYAAEKAIRSAIKKRDPAAAKRLDWDTEAGAVGIYAKTESDIRLAAETVGDLLKARSELR